MPRLCRPHLLTSLVVWLGLSPSWAQTVVRIDSLPQQGLLLDKAWKWHLGDKPAWARADLDDARWDTLNPNQDVALLATLPPQGIGWLRIRLSLSPQVRNKPLGLSIQQSGASEFFLNGRLIARRGMIGPQKQIVRGAVYDFISFLPLDTDSVQLLAIRYAFTRERVLNYPFSFLDGRLVLLEVHENRAGEEAWNLFGFFSAGFFLILGLLQLLLYRVSTQQPAALSLGLFLILQGIAQVTSQYFEPLLGFSATALSLDWQAVLFCLSVFPSFFWYLLGICQHFGQPRRGFFWLAATSTLSAIPLTFFTVSPHLPLPAFVLGIILPGLVILGVGLAAIRQQKVGSKPFTVIHSFFLLVYLVYVTSLFTPVFSSFFTTYGLTLLTLGNLSLALIVSLLLTQERAATNRLLSQQVRELRALSQQNLDQQAEKQQLLATQNERLEQQVEARTVELKASQAQLIQKEKLASLGELTAGIAHEIQNPLNFVNNFSEVSAELVDDLELELNKGDMDEVKAIAGDLRQNLHKIHHHGGKASAIVKGMLEHARTATGDLQSTNLNALVDEYLRLAYQGWRAKNKDFTCEVTTHFDSSVGPVTLIPQELGRVLLNLLNNAFYAVLERGKQRDVADYRPTVQVSTQREEGQVMIRVEDNGTGISDSVKAKIFQPFFTTKPTGEGTGLGLSLSYDIVTKGHGGTLTLESQEGNGTTFTILLPAELSTNTDESHTH